MRRTKGMVMAPVGPTTSRVLAVGGGNRAMVLELRVPVSSSALVIDTLTIGECAASASRQAQVVSSTGTIAA